MFITEEELANFHEITPILIKKGEGIGKFLQKDENAFFAVPDLIVDLNSKAFLYFESIVDKIALRKNKKAYFKIEVNLTNYYRYEDNAFIWNSEETIKYLLKLFEDTLITFENDLKKVNNDEQLTKMRILFDKDIWVFMKTKEKRQKKLNQLNI